MAETIWVLDEGGGIQAMDLPLPDGIAQRLAKGEIKRVANQAGDPWIEPEPVPAGADVPKAPRKAAKRAQAAAK